MEIKPNTESLITDIFNGELLWKFELDKPLDNGQHGTQARLGLQSAVFKFVTYGGEIGYGSSVYVDYAKRFPLHNDEPVTSNQLKRSHGFLFNTFVGAHLPMNFKAFYLVPGANLSFSGLIAENNNSALVFSYAPTATLDFGVKMKYGSVMLL